MYLITYLIMYLIMYLRRPNGLAWQLGRYILPIGEKHLYCPISRLPPRLALLDMVLRFSYNRQIEWTIESHSA